MKRTLKRELKVLEIVKREAMATSGDFPIGALRNLSSGTIRLVVWFFGSLYCVHLRCYLSSLSGVSVA